MKPKTIYLAFLLLPSITADAAQTSSAATLLQTPISVRATGMGEAYTASDDDVFGIHYNPAEGLKSKQLSLLYQKGNFDDSVGAFAFGMPVSRGKVAGSLLYYNGGNITLTDTDGNSRTVSAQMDYLATVSGGWSPFGNLAFGGNLKVLRSQLVGEFTGTAYLFDLGTIYKPYSWMSLGFAVQNMGTGIKYAGVEESIPKTARVGVSFNQRYLSHRFIAAFDILSNSDEGTPKEHFGVEYTYASTIALRMGYKAGYDTVGPAFGAGFMASIVTVDMAIEPSTSQLGTKTKISTTLRF